MPAVKDTPDGGICADLSVHGLDRKAKDMAGDDRLLLHRDAVLYDDTDADTAGCRNRQCHRMSVRRRVVRSGIRRTQQPSVKKDELSIISSEIIPCASPGGIMSEGHGIGRAVVLSVMEAVEQERRQGQGVQQGQKPAVHLWLYAGNF